ncbi:hypothetical protein CMMCAS02_00215 [Clavibacter michiganensis subsp. michiganensis]|uniref:Uncharacterized protein n=1 Tax=Clavibacter michiganensis subsp. michiganensis TaxID=33013 RepID=A0A1Y3FAW8_CLAMM|nr:hypothetical protein DOU02_14715 [Clavibacter michiganensis subsp. michiganensis]OUD81321.1 hypothetical protein CMMCAS02_00215 [Clavibacter michiganensis subsp. michiganensis]OUD87750.1 hypothetical protein BC477_07140 [Clavibacter michiganensis subsp. michiganensis]OUD90192.1 hypothetical protein CMMCAS05_12100 [Clavibacter michiganensis subsp. michiganensis]OUD90273.1 hypothetical protein CMMCAS04_12475 [Clavibacter michiganensis subsp. michiganensis]
MNRLMSKVEEVLCVKAASFEVVEIGMRTSLNVLWRPGGCYDWKRLR